MTESLMSLIELQTLDNAVEGGVVKATPYRRRKRRELVSRIPESMEQYYKRLRTRHSDAVVAVVDHVCQGCYVQLPPAVLVRFDQPREEVHCDHCGRILYRP